MKQQFIRSLIFSVVAVLPSVPVWAQVPDYKTMPLVTVTSTTKVSAEVAKSFNTSFPDAINTAWSKADQNYLARFISMDQNNRALYDKDGKLIYHLRWGKESSLPENGKSQVKSAYPGYNITSVIYVNQSNRELWVVNVEDKKKLVIVRFENDELQEIETYDKM